MSVDDDRAFARLSQEYPGFAGYVVDPSGPTLVVSSTSSLSEDELSALQQDLAVLDGRELLDMSIEQVPADYDFAQLKSWYDPLVRDVMALPGVTATDIDERSNRIVIGVESPRKHSSAVRELVSDQGVPEDALLIKRMSAITPD